MPEDVPVFPYLIAGDQGEVICFLHGFLGCKEDWMPVVRHLSNDCFCLSFDLPGHGEHTKQDEIPSFDDTIEMLDEERRRLGIERWSLAGYSMGGRMALHYALRFPDRVHTLTLLSASPGIEQEDAREKRRHGDAQWINRIQHERPDDFLSSWYNQPVFESLQSNEALLRSMITKRSAYSGPHLIQVLSKWGQGTVVPVWDELEQLSMPVLAIIGEKDLSYRLHLDRMKQRSDKIHGVVIDNAGHTVQIEKPEQTAAAIKKFMKDRGRL